MFHYVMDLRSFWCFIVHKCICKYSSLHSGVIKIATKLHLHFHLIVEMFLFSLFFFLKFLNFIHSYVHILFGPFLSPAPYTLPLPPHSPFNDQLTFQKCILNSLYVLNIFFNFLIDFSLSLWSDKGHYENILVFAKTHFMF
jgi:hypothetical protein